ncbi:phage baseplate assembly protein V [Actinophytocola sp.]|uniref:phage baseplate assembly protein V n=1 Tax=Actinophytocola sp. TaxID=1872138 RepID=UPI002EDAFC6A
MTISGMFSPNPVANAEPSVRATVLVNSTPLQSAVDSRITRVVVDNDVLLPGMAEVTFLDSDGATMRLSGIQIGSQLTVVGGAANGAGVGQPLIVAEVTSIEGLIDGLTVKTVVRGYSGAHRLQRARRSRSFLNVTDADVARQLAVAAGLGIGMIVPTATTHAYLPQVNQTDWEFLSARAKEIGYEVGVTNGLFHFRPSGDSLASAGGGLKGMAISMASAALSAATGATVSFPASLLSFRPRVTAGNLTPDVEVRVWDPMTRQAYAQPANLPAGPPPSPANFGGQFSTGLAAVGNALLAGDISGAAGAAVTAGVSRATEAAAGMASGGLGGVVGSPVGYLGPAPSRTAHVMVDRPLADATTMATTGPMVAAALGSALGGTYAEAEGAAKGDPAIQPGTMLTVEGVPDPFAGQWRVSRARHIFDDSEHGYRTVFSAHGGQDRTMLGLTSKSAARPAHRATIDGVVCGVVSNCADPLGKGRVKVTLPWLAPDFETDWAPNVQFCSGQRGGAMFMPEVGDEVLLSFELGDPRRPYVLGAMMNNLTQWNVSAAGPIAAGGLAGLGEAGAMIAGQLAGAAIGGALLGPAGGLIGGAIGSQAGASVMNDVSQSLDGSVLAPGMLTEIHHRGIVSSTGNALVFYDVPPPLEPPSVPEVAGAAGISTGLDAGGGTGPAAAATPSMVPPLSSAVRLGSQKGEIGVTVDQVNGGVSISAAPVPGVTTMPVPNINISAQNGFVNIGAGASGTMMIDGGMNLIIKSTTAVTIQAPTINLLGLPLVNGVPIPL